MSKLTLSEAIDISQKDLMTYPDSQIKDAADRYNIPITDKQSMTKKLAEKIILSNAEPHMLLEKEDSKCRVYLNKLEKEDISSKTGDIYNQYKKYKDSVSDMTVDDLYSLFENYDKLFFDNELSKYMKEKNYKLIFKTDGEPTFTTESICYGGRKGKKCDYTITVPIHKFKRGGTVVGGKLCKDQLESLQRAFEHEIVHLVVFMFCEDEIITNQHGKLYMNMVSGLFDQTDYRHYIF